MDISAKNILSPSNDESLNALPWTFRIYLGRKMKFIFAFILLFRCTAHTKREYKSVAALVTMFFCFVSEKAS